MLGRTQEQHAFPQILSLGDFTGLGLERKSLLRNLFGSRRFLHLQHFVVLTQAVDETVRVALSRNARR